MLQRIALAFAVLVLAGCGTQPRLAAPTRVDALVQAQAANPYLGLHDIHVATGHYHDFYCNAYLALHTGAGRELDLLDFGSYVTLLFNGGALGAKKSGLVLEAIAAALADPRNQASDVQQALQRYQGLLQKQAK